MQRCVATAACVALLAVNSTGRAAVDALRSTTPPAAAFDAAASTWRGPQGETELLGVSINEVDQPDDVLALRLSARSLAVPIESLALWRLRRPDAPVSRHEGHEYIALDAIAGLRWKIDAARQTLRIEAPAAAFMRNDFEVVGQERPVQASTGVGAFANYDLHWQRDGGTAGAPATQVTGALIEAGAFNALGNGRSTGIWRSAGATPRFTRLDTTWNTDLPESISSVRVGDAISVAGAWGRSVRFGGVQWATNFAVQPGLVTFPMPAIRGEATVPSIVDLYVNNARQLQGKVPPGAFDLPDVPVITGQGQIKMVVRDLLGREQVIVQPYYVSPALLRPGLHDFAVEAGTVRDDYGLDSNHYGRALITATDRAGISSEFTREVRAELLREQQTVGVSGVWLIRQFAVASLSGAASRGPDGTGGLVAGSVEHQAGDWSASVQARASSRSFVQLGQDTLLGQSPRAMVSANVATVVGNGGIGLNFLRQSTWQGDSFQSLTLNYGRSLGAIGYVSFFASRSTGSVGGVTMGINLIHVLDGNASASASSFRTRDTSASFGGSRDTIQNVLQLQGSAPSGPGFGYQVQAERGSFERNSADATWQGEHMTVTAGAGRAGDADSYRGGVSGGLAWMPEGVFLSRHIEGSFAVVQVGDYAGVRVNRDNQFVARTDDRGYAFVAGLRGFETNRLSVEAGDLPLDAQVDQLQMAVAPGTGSGVSVRFPVRRSRVASLRLVTPDGTPVPAGSWVHIDGDSREYPVGFDGKLFLSGLSDRNRLVAVWDGHRCDAQISVKADDDAVPELGTTLCR